MYHGITKASMKGSQLFIPDATSARPFRNIFQSSKKKKKKKKIMDIGRAKISCIFSIDTAMTSFVPPFFFFPLHSFSPTFNPHYLFSFSRCLCTFPIVISARNCRERKRKRDGSIQSDFKKLMIGIFMSRKEVMHTRNFRIHMYLRASDFPRLRR